MPHSRGHPLPVARAIQQKVAGHLDQTGAHVARKTTRFQSNRAFFGTELFEPGQFTQRKRIGQILTVDQ